MKRKRYDPIQDKQVDVVIRKWLDIKDGSMFPKSPEEIAKQVEPVLFADGVLWEVPWQDEVMHTFMNSEYQDEVVEVYLAEKLGKTVYAVRIQWIQMTTPNHGRHSNKINDKLNEVLQYAK